MVEDLVPEIFIVRCLVGCCSLVSLYLRAYLFGYLLRNGCSNSILVAVASEEVVLLVKLFDYLKLLGEVGVVQYDDVLYKHYSIFETKDSDGCCVISIAKVYSYVVCLSMRSVVVVEVKDAGVKKRSLSVCPFAFVFNRELLWIGYELADFVYVNRKTLLYG